jgi:hypothetical protein
VKEGKGRGFIYLPSGRSDMFMDGGVSLRRGKILFLHGVVSGLVLQTPWLYES